MAKLPEKPRGTSGESPPENEATFASELAKRVTAIVGKQHAAQVIAQVTSLTSERFSGPIAHPAHLREYEDILPGTADRIICMAENQLSHDQDCEKIVIRGALDDTREGRRYGFLALLSLIFGAALCAYLGKDALACAFLGTGAIGTVGAFIQGRRSSTKE